MLIFRLMVFFICTISAGYATMKFALSKECKSCHTVIYNEFVASMHFKATPSKDPIHKAVWDRHPKNTKAQKYVCGKCHTPAADNLEAMLGKGKAFQNVTALADANNPSHEEAISCAYCHRIESIEHGTYSNNNIISKKEKHYFGSMKDAVASSFHTISTDNESFKNGNNCMGCHSHNRNKAGLNLCTTHGNNKSDKTTCISCHMPKVKGSVSNLRATQTHAFHGFPGAHSHQEMLADYIDIEVTEKAKGFEVIVNNKAPHALLLHPLRVAKLFVEIERQDKKISIKPHTFVRIIGKDGKASPPWLADMVVKDSMLQGDQKRVMQYETALQKGDRVTVHLGYYLVNPKALKSLDLDGNEVARKFYTLKKSRFVIP